MIPRVRRPDGTEMFSFSDKIVQVSLYFLFKSERNRKKNKNTAHDNNHTNVVVVIITTLTNNLHSAMY